MDKLATNQVDASGMTVDQTAIHKDMSKTKRSSIAEWYQSVGLSGPVMIILVLALPFVPMLPGEYWTHVATEILILGMFAMSFNLIYGYMGQISFGHAAFFGLGAYATAIVMRSFTGGGEVEITNIQFFLALLAGPPVAGFGALIIGYFCVRLTGIYFAILTLAFGELIFFVVFQWYSFTGGDDGIQRLLPPPMLVSDVSYFYFTLIITIICLAVMWRITRSPFGYALRAMRDNQLRTRFLGINVRKYMLVNFVIAGTFAGVAGALWGPLTRSVNPPLLNWQESGLAVFMTLIGGAEFFIGPIVGSAIYTFLHAYVVGFKQFAPYWQLVIGIIILFLVLFAPGGVLGLFNNIIQRLRGSSTAEEHESNGGK